MDFSFADLATHVRELVELKAKNPLGRLFSADRRRGSAAAAG